MRRPITVTLPPKAAHLVLALVAVLLSAGLATMLLWEAHRRDRLLDSFYVVMGTVFLLGLTMVFTSACKQGREIGCQARLFRFIEEKELWNGITQWAEDCLSLRVLRSLHRQRRAQMSLDAEPFLGAMHARLVSRARLANSAGATCLSLGVLGTMAGMTGMLQDLQVAATTGALIAGDGGGSLFKQLFGAGGPLDSLGTAFLTTLVGGAANLVLRNLHHALDSSATWITGHLEDAIARNFGPAIDGEEGGIA